MSDADDLACHTCCSLRGLTMKKRVGVLISCGAVVAFAFGCGEGGVEVGAPTDTSKGPVTNEFREAMQKAGNKMTKNQKPKDFGAKPKQ